jgi:hypothetical protein
MKIEPGKFTYKGVPFLVDVSTDPENVTSVLKKFSAPVRKAISLIDNEEAFFEITCGRHDEHPYLHHCLIHFDKRPGKIDTIYNI